MCRSPSISGYVGAAARALLGRAARLIEGPNSLLTIETMETTRVQRSRRESHGARSRQTFKTITLNGGSLGSWVDEERS